MTVNNKRILQTIQQLESLLLHGDIFKEIDSHPLIDLRDQLEEIDQNSQPISGDEIRHLHSTLHHFEIDYFSQLIKRYSSTIPSSILKALIDCISLHIYLSMTIHPMITDYYFDFSLTYLTSDSTIDYLMDKNNVIPSDIDEHFLHFFSSIGSRAVYIKTHTSYSLYVSHQNIPMFFQLNHSTERLLKTLILYLDNHHQYQSSISILKWLVNMTNIRGFIPYFVKTGYPHAILQWISVNRDIPLQTSDLIISLLHNLARHWMGAKALNKLKAIALLKQWREEYLSQFLIVDSSEESKDILLTYHLVYAILLEPKELKKENISNIQTVLDYILERTIQAFQSPDLSCGPYNICEYLHGLAKLVVNDTFLLYIISCEHVYELFIDKFLLFNTICETTALNTVICASLYTIFWSISFQSEYNLQLTSNEIFLSLVKQTAANQSNNEHALVMRRAAKGILFNLDCIQMDVESIELDLTLNNQIKVMISYAHKDKTFCRKLLTNLQERFTSDIWVDFNKLSPPYDDDCEEIAKAITQCDVVLMIVTENYCSSKSCRREVIHADKRNKSMIPIYQGKDYVPEDWFEIRVGSATWVRFGDKRSDDEVMETLLGLINAYDKGKQSSKELVHPTEPVIQHEQTFDLTPIGKTPEVESSVQVLSTTPIEHWTAREVQEWLHLPSSVLQLSSGRALLAYMNLLSHNDAQYDEYEHRMRTHGVSREQFSNLLSSFTSIRPLSNIEFASTEVPERWTCEEIKHWFEQNHLSNQLFNTLQLLDGSHLITYAKLIVDSPSRIDEEYNRFKNHIGENCFHLDEYARLLTGLKELLNQSKTTEQSSSCIIL